ncbi:MAG: glutamate racemase [Thermodesulfovibrionia bacterium]
MRIAMRRMPIGIFDSGVGGLTVMKEIMKQLPMESIIYLGDTARVPYGIRSPETVLRYSIENANFLSSRGIKLLVIACNTSSAISLPVLRERLNIPVVGVIEPGARAAVRVTKTGRIAVIGTETTIRSGAYERAIKGIDETIDVKGIACPLFVPLVEEGWLNGEVVRLVAERYLSSLKYDSFDTLVLGCTHYPMIKDVISDVVRANLIDSAIETAREVKEILKEGDMFNDDGQPVMEFFVTDAPEKFREMGSRFFGHGITDVCKITLGGE